MINNVKKGISTIILATLFFAIMDGVSRYLVETYNVFIINMIRSWVLALFVILISLRKKNGIKKVLYSKQPILQFIRGLLLTLAILIGVYSFTKLGLVQTHSIMSVFPLIVVALSGPILNEKIGIQRWLAVVFGFIGIIIILEPSEFILDFDNSYRWMYRLEESKILEKSNDTLFYVYFKMEMGWPLKKRDLVSDVKILREDNIVTVDLTSTPGYIPLYKNLIRIIDSKSTWTLSNIDSNKTKVTLQSYAEIDNIPSFVIDMFILDGPLHSMKNLRKIF